MSETRDGPSPARDLVDMTTATLVLVLVAYAAVTTAPSAAAAAGAVSLSVLALAAALALASHLRAVTTPRVCVPYADVCVVTEHR